MPLPQGRRLYSNLLRFALQQKIDHPEIQNLRYQKAAEHLGASVKIVTGVYKEITKDHPDEALPKKQTPPPWRRNKHVPVRPEDLVPDIFAVKPRSRAELYLVAYARRYPDQGVNLTRAAEQLKINRSTVSRVRRALSVTDPDVTPYVDKSILRKSRMKRNRNTNLKTTE